MEGGATKLVETRQQNNMAQLGDCKTFVDSIGTRNANLEN